MWPTLVLVALFVAVMAALPWLVRRLQQKNLLPKALGMARGIAPMPAQLLGSLAIGPQQRVITVQVGEGEEAVRMVLGVTTQQIQCLHVLQPIKNSGLNAHDLVAKRTTTPCFSDSLERAQGGSGSVQGVGNV